MDRKTQLSNVAFGGAWSEEIAGQEALQHARCVLEEAVKRCGEVDLREDREVEAALQLLTARHPKGAMLRAAWEHACDIKERDIRQKEIRRITEIFLFFGRAQTTA